MTDNTHDAQFWDRAATKYAAAPIKDMTGYERTIARTRELLGASDIVLEIGCGTGTTALKLAAAVHRLVATDVSSEMIAIARRKSDAEGCRNAEFAVAAAASAPDRPGGYDAALAFNVLHLVADRRALFAAVHERLKPGGLFISKTPCLSEMNRLLRLAVPLARFAGKAPHVSFFTATEIEGEIAGAGFTIFERARHGSTRKDPRIFLVARKQAAGGARA